MSNFAPIAIVGLGCVLPGARNADELWQLVASGGCAIGPAPRGRWRLDPTRVLSRGQGGERALCDAGGYVTASLGFDPSEVGRVPDFARLDPLVHWLYASGRDALRSVRGTILPSRTGLIAGNLSYPTESHSQYVEAYWLGKRSGIDPGASVDARNRFSSGLPVHLAALALDLEGPAFAIDAACASSLYALKLACDRLHAGDADLMLAGGVNRADDLFLHLGFTSLQALSPSGRSSPLQAHADGLVPAEGAALVALKRLDDAITDEDGILGVIRGIGLSNDGRQNGFLAPAIEGQVAAMSRAYEQAGLSPRDVGLIEAHATGTPRGDTIEIESLARVFGQQSGAVVGSLKASLGHTITASGAASLIKVVTAFARRTLPPMPEAGEPLSAIAASGFRYLRRAEPWEAQGRRRAAVSNFGFGGNNAHLIVEEWTGEAPQMASRLRRSKREPVCAVAMGTVTGCAPSLEGFLKQLFRPRKKPADPIAELSLPLDGLGFPPNELRASLGQQVAMLAAAEDALSRVRALPKERTGVFVGMGCDTTIARHGLRARLEQLTGADGTQADAWREANRAAAPMLTADGVLGTMPNIPANRFHAQRDWRGFGFTVSSEELSGLDALDVAIRALMAHELDAALVGACDLSEEPAHKAAISAMLPHAPTAADGAVALVLKRVADAERDGDPILAVISCPEDIPDGVETRLSGPPASESEVSSRLGHAHAASGLMVLAAGIAEIASGARVTKSGAAPWVTHGRQRSLALEAFSFSGRMKIVRLDSHASGMSCPLLVPLEAPVMQTYAASSRAALAEAIAGGVEAQSGPCRLAIIGESIDALESARQQALANLREGEVPAGPSLFYGEGAIQGEIGFTFTGAAAAYPGAARDLMLAFPEIGDVLAQRHAGAPELASRLYDPSVSHFAPAVQLTSGAMVAQAHAIFTRQILRIAPQAAIGLSSGETNSLLAFGVWRDLDAMLGEIDVSGLYGEVLTGSCRAAAAYWGLPEDAPVAWKCFRLSVPVEAVEKALAGETRAYMTIIHADDDCVIGGEASACRRVVEQVGRSRAIDLGLDMIVHCPALSPFKEEWHRIHSRVSHPAPGVRFYTHAGNRAYVPTREAAADAITYQALNPIDFRKTLEAAYSDGVRVFIEHGPRGILTSATERILGERPFAAFALDRRERPGFTRLCETVLSLFAAGVPLSLDLFKARVLALYAAETPRAAKRFIRFDAHPPDIVWPAMASTKSEGVSKHEGEVMAVPPALLPVLAFQAVRPAAMPARKANPVAEARMVPDHLQSLWSRIVEAHKAHLGLQTALQEEFLSFRQQAVGAAASLPARAPHRSAGPVPLPPIPLTARPQLGVDQAKPNSAPRPAAPSLSKTPVAVLKSEARSLSRAELETLAGGRISDVFGPLFTQQDPYQRQVRMPMPPLLLADRVVALEGVPGSMGRGRIITETDVTPGAWYLHHGRMVPGIVIESGQADLLLISWLGADFINKGERVYRLLGCEMTSYGALPRPGDTLRYDIRVDGHAKTGGVRLFFFSYDCHVGDKLLVSVRNGQAGFFTDEELKSSGGVLWEAAEDTPRAGARLDPAPCVSPRRAFTKEAVSAFAAGDAFACFGPGFEMAAAHQRTPTIPSGRLLLIDEVPEFSPNGGPWSRGYLRARQVVAPDAWFYESHFKDDPCMPGTLMVDAATQALAFAMAGLGFTIARDGWRFEPVENETMKFVCRGQVIPDGTHVLDYEVYIEEIIDGETPTVFASLLCRSDGFKVFHCRRFGLRLVPDWPLETRKDILPAQVLPRFVGPSGDVRGDDIALLSCAWGRPSDAFGQLYAPFDGARRAPRLPGPPYHLMTRVITVDAPPGVPKAGASVQAQYDVPADAWYFGSTEGTMPFAVLLEVLLQPCGWLASYLGFAASRPEDVAFRNLDGDDAVMLRAVRPNDGRIDVEARLDRFAQAAGTTLVFFSVTARVDEETVMRLRTGFGFFAPKALASQAGLPTSESDRIRLGAAPLSSPIRISEDVRLAAMPSWSRGAMRMLDLVTGLWPHGGEKGLGRIRGEQAVDPYAWYFKAHFFQDPVQPGSLGLEALIQLLEAAILLLGLANGITRPQFEPIALHQSVSWRFRGQIVPTNKTVISELEITQIEQEQDGAQRVSARGSLWVDGLRIYALEGLAMRVREG
ncbi:MAG: beta keto-acyl synthase [Alphaproteobacteria bacterium]|nr:beta keto-acyl synthase [Alphaproteobacteria bacterium]